MPILSGKCTSKARLDGKTSIVTGCNTGIGRETVKDFYKRGCRVIMACRDLKKAEDAAQAIRQETKDLENLGLIIIMSLDLGSFKSIREFVKRILETEAEINLLINNAGVAFCPRKLTEDGFESQFAVNHLGHFLLTLLLLPRILRSTPARIVTVSSLLHEIGKIYFDDINGEKSYSAPGAYNNSKLANVLFSKELSNRLQGKNVMTYCLHPGSVNTDAGRHYDTAYFPGSHWILKNLIGPMIKTPKQGAQTTIYCAVEESLADKTGLYYSDCKKKKPSSRGRDPNLAIRLWEESIKWVGLVGYDPFTPDNGILDDSSKTQGNVKQVDINKTDDVKLVDNSKIAGNGKAVDSKTADNEKIVDSKTADHENVVDSNTADNENVGDSKTAENEKVVNSSTTAGNVKPVDNSKTDVEQVDSNKTEDVQLVDNSKIADNENVVDRKTADNEKALDNHNAIDGKPRQVV